MNIDNLIKFYNDKNAIREAVIVLFLDSPIARVERFKELYLTELAVEFQKFDLLQGVEINVSIQSGQINQSKSPERINGFRALKLAEGGPKFVIQGINDPGRYYFSFHDLNYTRWVDFKENYQKYTEIFGNFANDLGIKVVSLHYIDEFEWIGEQKLDLSLVFQDKSKLIPEEFIESNQSHIIFEMEKSFEGIRFTDRIEITVNNPIRNIIRISHNSNYNTSKIYSIKEAYKPDEMQKILETAHNHNKEVLKQILSDNILKRIDLK
jgi:uncharacterized protein (TIGR04255 family)